MSEHEIHDAARVLTKRCYGGAKASGWHNDPATGQPRSSQQNHELFPVRLMLIVSDVSEFRWVDDGLHEIIPVFEIKEQESKARFNICDND